MGRIGEPPNAAPGHGVRAALIEGAAVLSRDGQGSGRADLRVRRPEERDVHADRRGKRGERRVRCGAHRHGREDDRYDNEAREPELHDLLAYTSGLSTPTNGRLRYRSA